MLYGLLAFFFCLLPFCYSLAGLIVTHPGQSRHSGVWGISFTLRYFHSCYADAAAMAQATTHRQIVEILSYIIKHN
jgi:hypothetical protein